MEMPDTELPKAAKRYLKHPENKTREPVVRQLHGWLKRHNISLLELTKENFNQFLKRPLQTELLEVSQRALHSRLNPYLLWLYEQKLTSFAFHGNIRKPYVLPGKAREFIDTLRPVLKSGTCEGYTFSLRAFHRWLDTEKLALHDINRLLAERWLAYLASRGLAPPTRCKMILDVRRYLFWLAERGDFNGDPGYLLRIEDLPKIPSYLPRPFPLEIDIELQRRFRNVDTVYGLALFLMRRTGMRIGELIRLGPQCLSEDLNGNIFIKVPLGKLDNERLVPLDAEAREVAEQLRKLCPNNASFLIKPDFSRYTVMGGMCRTLAETAKGLDISGPVVSHRLRHTYATQLLNAGMSLVGIMKLLGHRSISMTMRYAAVTQETVVKDYFKAISAISSRYTLPENFAAIIPGDPPKPDQMLRDVISWLRNNDDTNGNAQRLITRIHKIRHEISCLENKKPPL